MLATAPMELVSQAGLLVDGARLALALRHPVYDYLYLALAKQRGAPVVTADRRFWQAVQGHAEQEGAAVLLDDF